MKPNAELLETWPTGVVASSDLIARLSNIDVTVAGWEAAGAVVVVEASLTWTSPNSEPLAADGASPEVSASQSPKRLPLVGGGGGGTLGGFDGGATGADPATLSPPKSEGSVAGAGVSLGG